MSAADCYRRLIFGWMLLLVSCAVGVARPAGIHEPPEMMKLHRIAAVSLWEGNVRGPGEEGQQVYLASYAKRLMERFGKSPVLISILYAVIFYSILTLVILLIVILLNRRRIRREEEQRETLKEKYQEILMDYLFENEKRAISLEVLNQVASNPFNRQILIDQMIDLSINLKGEIKEETRELYLQLGLKEDSMKKAYSRRWHENIKGFRELAFMNIRDAVERIKECLNSSNEILKMEAQIAMVRLADENPYHFLDFMEKPFSVWEQLTLHELVVQHELPVPPFKQWFGSANLSVLIFALEMVSWFGQKDAGEEVTALFDHDDENVRRTAYRVSGEIGLKDALPLIKEHYASESYSNRLEILRTFGNLPDEQYLDFLKSVLDAEEDVQLQILATRAMENTGEPGISMLIRLMKSKSEYKNYQIIIRHVLDGRIY